MAPDGYPDEFHGLSSLWSHSGRKPNLAREDLESGDPDTSGGSTENEEMKDSEHEVSTSTS